MVTPNIDGASTPAPVSNVCIKQTGTRAFLSRDKLSQLLSVKNQAPKATVREILGEPHCVLEPGQTKDGGPMEREAYPLEFDPQTWLIVWYSQDAYQGYDFRFR
ncbi:MAG: hypothetical protein HC922_08430 [Leptolyngbyaceae cyanobacterium SM2_3_12]|nr:hypothetical protein [Leptolyngbyaceae cyanobacterium SM2_3_12]